MKKYFYFTSLLAGVVLLVVLVFKSRVAPQNASTLSVVASFYPLAHFVEQVGGNRISVVNLTPAGAEPHDFEPTPQDIVKLRNAKIILLNGAGFETWFESMQKSASQKLAALKMAEFVDLQTSPSGVPDPHIWLDPQNIIKIVGALRDRLILEDPAGSDVYKRNADEYIGKLRTLDESYASGLSSCQIREVIAPHSAFNYLGKRYKIKFIGISGLSPDQEPPPQRLAELTNIAKARGIKIIFFEELASSKLAQTIAREAGVQTDILNPIEGLTAQDVANGENYISLMEKNLVKLRKAMGCE